MSLTSFFALPAAWFTVPAMVGTFIFLFKLIFMAIGGHGHGHDFSAETDAAHAPGDLSHGHHSAHDASKANQGFKILSIQAVAAALMGFGWTGYGSLVGSSWPMFAHVSVGLAAGVLSGAAIIWMLRQLSKMKADGTLRHDALLGAEGDVYIQVPLRGKGHGQVRIVVGNRERFVSAVCDSMPLATRTRVLVVGTNPDNSFTVMPLDPLLAAPLPASAGLPTTEAPASSITAGEARAAVPIE